MAKITSLKPGYAEIDFSDFYLRIFIKRSGSYYSEIRIWKLPKNHRLIGMFNLKNLIWAIYGDDVKRLQGWFFRDNPDLLKVITSKIEQCNNEEDLKRALITFEQVAKGEIPLDDLMKEFDE